MDLPEMNAFKKLLRLCEAPLPSVVPSKTHYGPQLFFRAQKSA